MQIEFFPERGLDTPCILIHSGSLDDYRLLRETCAGLACGTVPSAEMHRLPGFSGVPLVATVAMREVGVRRVGSADVFHWALDTESWECVVELLKPFAAQVCEKHGHQYLDCNAGRINVIISTDRTW